MAPESSLDYDSLREVVLEKSPRDIRHELPQLIETITGEDDREKTPKWFNVGVSFTKKGTCFDYWIEAWHELGDEYRPRELKAAINPSHQYVPFSYPPDPYFDAGALRSCLLTAIEGQLSPDIHEGEPEIEPGFFRRIWRLIGGTTTTD